MRVTATVCIGSMSARNWKTKMHYLLYPFAIVLLLIGVTIVSV